MQTQILSRILTATANQLWVMLAPTVSRILTITVLITQDLETACTDGRLFILMPPLFEGVDLATEPSVATGLLAHELSHFLQPLEQMRETAKQVQAPRWLVNILLDIQGEELVVSLFPRMALPLTKLRQLVQDARYSSFIDYLETARDFADAAQAAALAGRFHTATEPFSALGPLGIWPRHVHEARLEQLLVLLYRARDTPARDLPTLLEEILHRFPELASCPASELPNPLDAVGHQVPGSAAPNRWVDHSARNASPLPPVPLITQEVTSWMIEQEAVRIARQLLPRFTSPSGQMVIVAPGRFDRRAAARGQGVPFQMTLPGKTAPAPQVVLAVDTSDSMHEEDPQKAWLARLAAQAIALAVKRGGGTTVGVVFSTRGVVSSRWDERMLFAPLAEWPRGGTNFGFLSEVWERFPAYQVILLTDGDGECPVALQSNRRRTVGIVIPPNCEPQKINPICERVVMLQDLSRLAWVIGMLIPRSTLG